MKREPEPAARRRQVVIYQSRLFHYRVPLFQRLRISAADRGIDLHVVHGTAAGDDRSKQDEGHLDWAVRARTHHLTVGAVELLWHRTPTHLRNPDMVILQQENRILSNYPHLLKPRPAGVLVTFWGHGRNFQSTAPAGLREKWKRLVLRQADYCFGYTSLTAEVLAKARVPVERVCILQNSIDTRELESQCAEVGPQDRDRLRGELGIGVGASVGLFCGSFYRGKRLDLLFAAADIIKRRIPGFHLVVVGAGPEEPLVRAAADMRPWVHAVGTRKGAEKARMFAMADALLNPGAVGLGVLDSFAAGVPLVTTRLTTHGPEVAYLTDKSNALFSAPEPEAYAAAVVALLEDPSSQSVIAGEARRCARIYSVDAMVRNFINGIERAFQLGPRTAPVARAWFRGNATRQGVW